MKNFYDPTIQVIHDSSANKGKAGTILRNFLLGCICSVTALIGYSQNFITEWTFDEATTDLEFGAYTDGDVTYTWSAIPSGNSGSGFFNQPSGSVVLSDLEIEAGDVMVLEMAPTNLNRFYMGNSYDHDNLTDIVQWGSVVWTSLSQTLHDCSNADISAADTPNMIAVTDMSRMFYSADSFNRDISDWNVAGVTNMTKMFYDAESFNQDLGNWDVSSVTDMEEMFWGALAFNGDISDWDVSNVVEIRGIFSEAASFNQPIGSWDVSGILDMSEMFMDAVSFNQDLNDWDVSGATHTGYMFDGADSFNQDLGDWDVSNVINMNYMFSHTDAFNGDIEGWDVSSVIFMNSVFSQAAVFNRDIGGWDVSSAETMGGLFRGTQAFNHDIGNWDVSGVTSMGLMFYEAEAFNQDISGWDVSNAENLTSMFNNAVSFNQNLGSWVFYTPVPVMNNFLRDAGIDCDHYTATLVGWQANNPDVINVTVDAQGLEYGPEAVAARDWLIEEQGWSINFDELSSEECGLLLSAPSISSAQTGAIAVFPNPAIDKIFIEAGEPELNRLRIFNAIGRDVTSETTIRRKTHHKLEADVSALANGVYLIKTATQTIRLVKN